MTAPRPLALDDAQLAVVMDFAARMPVEWRGRFLCAVADCMLSSANEPDGGDVQSACHHVLARIGVAS
jgi:hypothetical protein